MTTIRDRGKEDTEMRRRKQRIDPKAKPLDDWAEHARGYLAAGDLCWTIRQRTPLWIGDDAVTLNARVRDRTKHLVSLLWVTIRDTGEVFEISGSQFDRRKVWYRPNPDSGYAVPLRFWCPSTKACQLGNCAGAMSAGSGAMAFGLQRSE